MIDAEYTWNERLEFNSGNVVDTILDIKEYIETLKDKKRLDQYIYDLEMQNKTEALIKGICPECESDLEISRVSSGLVEYCGTRCREEITVAQCMNCGYVEE